MLLGGGQSCTSSVALANVSLGLGISCSNLEFSNYCKLY